MRYFLICLLLLARACVMTPLPAQPAIIERATARDAFMRFERAGADARPARTAAWVQPESGVHLRRITDTTEYKALWPDVQFVTVTTNTTYGMTNGYSRFECLSPYGDFLLGFGTTPYAVIHDAKTLTPMRVIRSVFTSSKKVGDAEELKWNPFDNQLYYVTRNIELKQQPELFIETGAWNWPTTAYYRHTSDGSFSNDGRLLAMAFNDKTVRVWDNVAGTTVAKVAYPSPNGVDVSPSGRVLKIDNRFYRMRDGSLIRTIQAGHGGWAIDADGREVFVSQHNSAGWIAGYYPDDDSFIWIQRMPGEDKTLSCAGMHCASDKRGYFKGWALISIYGGGSPLSDNVYFLEIKSQKKPGIMHPSYGGTLAAWNAGGVAAEDIPRVVRVASMQNKWAGYFSEGFASVGVDKAIYCGANWNGTDNLELYRLELTPQILDALGVRPQYPQTYRVAGPLTWSAEFPEGQFKITIDKE